MFGCLQRFDSLRVSSQEKHSFSPAFQLSCIPKVLRAFSPASRPVPAWALFPVSLPPWTGQPVPLSSPALACGFSSPQAPPSWCSGHREPLPAQRVGCVLLWDAEQLPESGLTARHLRGEMSPQCPVCLLGLLTFNSFTHLLGELSL